MKGGLGVYGRGCVVGCVYVCEGVDCWVCLTVFVRGGQGGCVCRVISFLYN